MLVILRFRWKVHIRSLCVSYSYWIFITWLVWAMQRASSCVSGCLSVGAKPTYTPDRKLHLYLGQHSPVHHPDSAPAALWERSPAQQSTHHVPLRSSLLFLLFVHCINSSFLLLAIPFIKQKNVTSCCWSKQDSVVGFSTPTHSSANTTYAALI